MTMTSRGSVVAAAAVSASFLVVVLLLNGFLCERIPPSFALADSSFAENIRRELMDTDVKPVAAENGEKPSSKRRGTGTTRTHALIPANSNPLSIPADAFKFMYAEMQALWGDCTEEEAYINYLRAQSGNVDSARLLMEFSMVPSVRTEGSPLHHAAVQGEVERVAELVDVEQGTGLVDPVKADGTTPLISAAMMNHTRVVELLIEQGAEVDKVGMNGATALHVAASMGNAQIVELLVNAGANPNMRHKFAGSTPLHFAAEMGNAAVVRMLCKLGADVEAEKVHGGRPLHIAADSNQTEVVRALVTDCGADTEALLLGDTTPLYLAAQNGFHGVAEILLEHGGRSDFAMPSDSHQGELATLDMDAYRAKYDLSSTGDADEHEMFKWARQFNSPTADPRSAEFEQGNGATALHAAVENNHIKVVEVLLAHGVDQQPSMGGVTPLYTAAEYNRPDIAKLLLEEGADPNEAMATTGFSALTRALMMRHQRVVEVLMEGGGDPNYLDMRHENNKKKNKKAISAMHYACAHGSDDMVSYLNQHGGDILLGDDAGRSCVHFAVENGRRHLVSMILDSGFVGVDVADSDGVTPLLESARAGNAHILGDLIERGADLKKKTRAKGLTALMLAAQSGNLQTVDALLSEDAKQGHALLTGLSLKRATALHFAAQKGYAEIAALLIEKGININARTEEGRAALYFASSGGHVACVELLLTHNAEINFRDASGKSALFRAAEKGHLRIASMLLERGAKVGTASKTGQSIIVKAYARKDLDMMRLLFEKDAALIDDVRQDAIARRETDVIKLIGEVEAAHAAAG